MSAWLLRATNSTRCSGWLRYSVAISCTATSVLPVPGGPSITVRPSCSPDRIASTCVGVNRTPARRVAGCSEKGSYSSRRPPADGEHTISSSSKVSLYGGTSVSTVAPLLLWKRTVVCGKLARTCAASSKVSPKSTVLLCARAL